MLDTFAKIYIMIDKEGESMKELGESMDTFIK